VLPGPPTNNIADLGLVDPILIGELLLGDSTRCIAIPDVSHSLIGELGLTHSLSTSRVTPPLFSKKNVRSGVDRVLRVFRKSAVIEVERVATRRVVAIVQSVVLELDVPELFKNDSVCHDRSSTRTTIGELGLSIPLPVASTRPFPALIRPLPVDVTEEAFEHWQSTLTWHPFILPEDIRAIQYKPRAIAQRLECP
jgi:hypothetical protein